MLDRLYDRPTEGGTEVELELSEDQELFLDTTRRFLAAEVPIPGQIFTALLRWPWKLLQIALIGQSELLEKISDPRLRHLRQRVAVEHHLSPLRAAGVAAIGLFALLLLRFSASPVAGSGGDVPVYLLTAHWLSPHTEVSEAAEYAARHSLFPPLYPLLLGLLAGADVAHGPDERIVGGRAPQVVTIHDLFFLTDPTSVTAEIRRDYPALVGSHARRAHVVITSTEHGKRLVSDRLGVERNRIHVCSPGAPTWRTLGRRPHVPRGGYLLFVGTLEPRKNVGALLDAYSILLGTHPEVPPLVIAGRSTPEAAPWLTRIAAPPLAGRVRLLGYVSDTERESLFAGARALILPSLDEGFGLPVLEAMSAGVPVVASNRGALPEVVGTSGILIDPTRPAELAAALASLVTDDAVAARWGAAGLERARAFSWTASAAALRLAYTEAIARRAR